MSRIDESLGRVNTKDELEILEKILEFKNELARKNEKLSLKDYGFRPDGSTEEKSMGVICNKMGLVSRMGVNLFNLVRSFQPESCIELGTGIGISSLYIAQALKLNKKGKLVTIEGDETLSELANDVFYSFDLDNVNLINGKFSEKLDTVLESSKPVDFVFIDGDHNEERTVQYYQKCVSAMKNDSIFILDDIRWSPGMRRAWEKICHNRNVEEHKDMNRLGVCLISKWQSRGRIGID